MSSIASLLNEYRSQSKPVAESPSVSGFIGNAYNDVMQIARDYYNNAVQGYDAMSDNANSLAENDPIALSGTPMKDGVTDAPPITQTPDQTQEMKDYQSSVNQFYNKTIAPPANRIAAFDAIVPNPVSTAAGLIALPGVVGSVGESYERGAKSGGVFGGAKQAAYDMTIAPIEDVLSQGSITQRLYEHPFSTIDQGAMAVAPWLMGARGVYEVGKRIRGGQEVSEPIPQNDVQDNIMSDLTESAQKVYEDAKETATRSGYSDAEAEAFAQDVAERSLDSSLDNGKLPEENYREFMARDDEQVRTASEEKYTTESGKPLEDATPNEFIVKSDGSPDLGEIAPEVADQINKAGYDFTPGKIRLQVGADEAGNRFGTVHTEIRHIDEIQKAGYKDVPSFVHDVLSNWNEIRDGGRGGLFMIKRGDPNGLAIIELAKETRDGESFYTVQSAWPTTKDRWINKKPLLAERPPQQPRLGQGPDLYGSPRNAEEGTAQGGISSNGSIKDNIQQSGKLFNGKDGKGTSVKELINNRRSVLDKASVIANKSAFVRDDVAPAVQQVAQTLTDSMDDIKTALAPASVSDASKITAGILRENLAEMAQKADRANAALEGARKYFSKMSNEDNLKFMDAIETGQKQPTPELQQFADTMREILDGRRQKIQDLGTGKLEKYIENYFPHMWKDPKKAENFAAAWFGKRPLEGKKSFLKSRSLPTIADGIAAGLEPLSHNPVDLVIMKMREMDKYIMAHKTLNELKGNGLVQFVQAMSADRPEGWTQIDDRIGTVYGSSKINVKEAFDPAIMDALNHTLDNLEVDHTRLTNVGLGKDSAGVWGYTDPYSEEVVTKFGGPESVVAHELGHQLAYKYNLDDMFRNDNTRVKAGKKYTTAGKEMSRELEILADKRLDPNETSDAQRKYVQQRTEPIAAVVESYVHAPELLKEMAPFVYDRFVKFLDEHPELHELRDVKPSLRLDESTAEQDVGGLVVRGHYYLPEDAARLINNYLSPGLRNKSSLFRAYMGAANVMNQFQLGMSAFHLGFTSMDSIVSKVGLGLIDLSHGDVKAAAKDIARAPLAPVENAMRGDKLYQEWLKPGSTDAQTAALVDALKAGGGRIKMDDMYQTKILDTMKDAWRQGNYAGAAWRVPFMVMEQSVKPILEYIVPRQKLGVFADLMRYEMERNPAMTRDELRRTAGLIWNSVDNRLGQLVYDNLFWNKTLKDLTMASVRSVGWNLGTFRELGGAAVDTAQQVGKIAKGERTELTYRMSYALALPITVGIFGAIIQYMYTGQAPQSIKDLFFPRTGTLDANGRPQRIELPSYMKDLYAYNEHPGQTLVNKLHGMLGVIANMIQNKDYYSRKIYNEDDNYLQKSADLMKFAAKQFMPFSLQGSKYQADLGGDMLSKSLPFIGITPAPSDVNKTDVEKKMSELLKARQPIGSRTQEQADKADLKRSILRDMQLNGGKPTASLQEAVRSNQISRREAQELTHNARLTPLQRNAQHLDADEIKHLIEIANPEEKEVLNKIYLQKMKNAKK